MNLVFPHKKYFAIFSILLFTASSCSTTSEMSSGDSTWDNAYRCASGLLETGITGPNIELISRNCIVVEQGQNLLFYTPLGLNSIKSSKVFEDEENKVCKSILRLKSVSKNFKENSEKYAHMLKLQFPNNELKPFKYDRALFAYNFKFISALGHCSTGNSANYLSKFSKNISLLKEHVAFLSKKREVYAKALKSKLTLKSLKKVGKTNWHAVAKISIVNNGAIDYQYSTTCDPASAYHTKSKNTYIAQSKCDDFTYDILTIPSKGVYRDEVGFYISSIKRPGGKEIDLYFGAAPSAYLGKVTIPK